MHSMLSCLLTNPAGYHHIEPAVDALIELARVREALELADLNLDRARTWGAPTTIALAQGSLASCPSPRKGLRLITDAIALLPAGAKLPRAEMLLRKGAMMISAEHPGEAQIALREGLDVATRIGARRIACASDAALRTLGARPRRPYTHGAESLTAAEERVASLAASRLPNREIADRLYLSVRTVENHLRHVYGKLATDRRGLAEALATGALNTATPGHPPPPPISQGQPAPPQRLVRFASAVTYIGADASYRAGGERPRPAGRRTARTTPHRGVSCHTRQRSSPCSARLG
ncbi:MAG: helix-turn-helix transcriptional regulator [Solirubrobacteraceae bacterium]